MLTKGEGAQTDSVFGGGRGEKEGVKIFKRNTYKMGKIII